MIDALLEDMDRLLGPGRVPGVSAADQARALTPPAVPATWTSKSAELLAGNHGTYTRASNTFAAADDETKGKVDEARTAVADGKSQMSAVKDDYKTNRDRLAPGAANPEVAQRMAELDRQRTSDGANTLRSTLGRMPGFGGGPGGGLAPLAQMMPAAMAPASAFGPAMMQPMNMLSGLQGLTAPATSMLSGLTLPQQVQAVPSFENDPASAGTARPNLGNYGPTNIRDVIDKALDIKGITDPQARANWAAGMTTVGQRESNFDLNARNDWDSNARKGIPSGGWLQFIEPTFRAYHEPGTSTVLNDPVAQACAFVNYAMGRYGVSADGHDLAAKIQQADPTRPPKGY